MEKLPIIFRAEKAGDFKGEVTAFFPTVYEGNGLWSCYAHVGQHSAGSRQYVQRHTRRATPEEYAPLLSELKSIYETGEDAVKLEIKERPTWRVNT